MGLIKFFKGEYSAEELKDKIFHSNKMEDIDPVKTIDNYIKKREELLKIKIEAWKKYCEENNEKLYKINFNWYEAYSFGRPEIKDNGNLVEFIDVEINKEVIQRVPINDSYRIEEL